MGYSALGSDETEAGAWPRGGGFTTSGQKANELWGNLGYAPMFDIVHLVTARRKYTYASEGVTGERARGQKVET